MIPNKIESEIRAQAPIEIVWQAVSQPEQLSSWFTDTAEIDLHPGGDGVLSWDARATNEAATARIRVMTIEPPHTLSFRWLHPADEQANERNSMLVEFALTAEGDHTRVRLVESALSMIAWPEDQRAKYADQSTHGWEIHLAHLNEYTSEKPTVAPSCSSTTSCSGRATTSAVRRARPARTR